MAEELESGDFVTASVRLVRPLAQGGMGTVWLADHLALECQVVVKLMSKDIGQHDGAASRFAREAAIAAAVKSPHVVQVFDTGVTDGGVPYIVMELLEGHDLGAHLLALGRLPPAEVARILGQLGKALGKAHRVSVVHRDIKPDNIYLCDAEGDEPFVKLLDFGTAKDDAHALHSTTLGQLIGTPYYMSPEQILGEPVDHRTDIWSLGVVAYEALTGVRPFDGVTVGAVTLAIHTLEPRPCAVVPTLPESLDAWFEKACARDPEKRFQTVRGAVAAFVRAVHGESALVDSSPGSLDDVTDAPPSSPALPASLAPLPTEALASSTSSLTATLGSTHARERKTMLWVAGVIGAAAVAATIALIRTDGGDRTTTPGAQPESTTSAPVVTATPTSEPAVPHALPAAAPTAQSTSLPIPTSQSTSLLQPPARPAFTALPSPAAPLRPAPSAFVLPSAAPAQASASASAAPSPPASSAEAPPEPSPTAAPTPAPLPSLPTSPPTPPAPTPPRADPARADAARAARRSAAALNDVTSRT